MGVIRSGLVGFLRMGPRDPSLQGMTPRIGFPSYSNCYTDKVVTFIPSHRSGFVCCTVPYMHCIDTSITTVPSRALEVD